MLSGQGNEFLTIGGIRRIFLISVIQEAKVQGDEKGEEFGCIGDEIKDNKKERDKEDEEGKRRDGGLAEEGEENIGERHDKSEYRE